MKALPAPIESANTLPKVLAVQEAGGRTVAPKRCSQN
jgi:hypothetical protein